METRLAWSPVMHYLGLLYRPNTAFRPPMHLAVHAISAKVGGAATYLHNVLPVLKQRIIAMPGGRILVWRGSSEGQWPDGIEYRHHAGATDRVGFTGILQRLWFDQVDVPAALRSERIDVLYSAANLGPLFCPCRQVLLVRNTIYFDATFMERVAPRVRFRYQLQRALVMRCMAAADAVLFPSRAMLDLAASHTGGPQPNWHVAHYGTRHDLFYPPHEPRSLAGGPVRLLNVSLYCDQKNLGTLLSAVHKLASTEPHRYQLDVTAGFERDWELDPAQFPAYQIDVSLFRDLHRRGIAHDTNWTSYLSLPSLYRSADIFVFTSYTESFGHPLVEAMSTGLPIVASDIPVNRELCQDAAIYFPVFDSAACAQAIRNVAEDASLRDRLRTEGLRRAKTLTWEHHVDQLVAAFSP